MRAFVDAARAEAEAKTRALANQQAVNAGVMRMKNAMEQRVLEMQAALEKAGEAAPPLVAPAVGWRTAAHPAFHPPPSAHPTRSPDAVERRERDSNHPGLRAVAAAPVRPQGRNPELAADDEQTDKGVRRSAPAVVVVGRRELARFRAMFPDLQSPEEMDDLAALDALDVAGAPALATDAKLSGDATPPPKTSRRVKRVRADEKSQTEDPSRTDPSGAEGAPASTAAPLIAKGNHASYGATAPAGPVLLSGGSGPRSPTRGPEVRQTKSPPPRRRLTARCTRPSSWPSRSRTTRRGRGRSTPRRLRDPPPASPAKAATPAADEKAETEFDAFLREIDEDHPYQPLASDESDEGEASDRVLRAPPNPWAGDPRAAVGAAASPGPDFPLSAR